MHQGRTHPADPDIPLAAKVAFLGRPSSYPKRPSQVSGHETHMSWIFVAGDTVYKLKKPVRFTFLDFSSIERREAACRAELAVNRKLAGDVYLGIVPLTLAPGGMSIGGHGAPVDWLITMRRLDEQTTLDRALRDGAIDVQRLDRLSAILSEYYLHAKSVPVTPEAHLREWRTRLSENRRVLFNSRFQLDLARLVAVDLAQRRFLAECAPLLRRRSERRRIVDGHGDLRPEHIFLGRPIAIIDRVEFSRRYRIVDPFDELASLAVECERLGFGWVGERVSRRVGLRLHDRVSPELSGFYRCYRATLRARLAIAHLLESDGRTPERWPALAKQYLDIALGEARFISSFLDWQRRRPRTGDGIRDEGPAGRAF